MDIDGTKDALLREAGYRYHFDRMAYINHKERKIFSVEAIEDNTADWLGERIREPNESGDWRFCFNDLPSESVRRAFVAELE